MTELAVLASALKGQAHTTRLVVSFVPCVYPCPLITIVMSRTVDPQRDPEQGLGPWADEDLERGTYLAQEGDLMHLMNGVETNERSNDFDDNADELWSLYEKVARRHDEARIRALKDNMEGIPVYVCAYFPAQ
jgi:hypothetical protein